MGTNDRSGVGSLLALIGIASLSAGYVTFVSLLEEVSRLDLSGIPFVPVGSLAFLAVIGVSGSLPFSR